MGKEIYDGQLMPFSFPRMTWDDYFEIMDIMRKCENTPNYDKFCSREYKMIPFKVRTKEYIIEIIKSTQQTDADNNIEALDVDDRNIFKGVKQETDPIKQKECIDKARRLIAETKKKMEEGKQC